MKRPMASFCIQIFLLLSLVFLWSCNRNKNGQAQALQQSNQEFANQLKNRGSYDSAIVFFRKAAEYSLKQKQYPLWVENVSGLIDCYRSKGDLNQAMQLTDESIGIAAKTIDTLGNLYNGLVHKKALLYSDKRQFAEASALFERNINVYKNRSSKADTGLALSYNGMGTVYLYQNLFDEALQEYQKAIETYEQSNHIKNSNYASSLQNIGIVYSMTGNYEKAEQYFLKSLKVNQEVLQPNDPKLASFYNNMGRFYQLVRNDLKALEYMKRAENFYITQNQSNSIMAGSVFLNLGVIYIYTADYEKAQSYLDKSLEIMLSKSPGNLADLLTLYLNMGFIAEKKGDYTTAKSYYLKGLAIGTKLPNSVKVMRGLANVYYKMNDASDADLYYKQALAKSIEMYGNNHPETALTYLRYGDFLSDLGNKEALLYLNKSLELYKNTFGNVNIDVSTAYNYIGRYYDRIHQYDKALRNIQLSLMAGFPGFSSQNIADNPVISPENLNVNLLNPLIAKSTALLSLYASDTTRTVLLKNSISSFNVALKMIEMLRSSYQDEDSKLFISENEKNTFVNALTAQVKLYDKTKKPEALEEAFRLSEKGKSAVLLSHLRDKEARNIGRIPENLRNQDASLKSEIYFYNKQIHDQKLLAKPDESKIKLWNSRLFDLGRKQDDLIKSIEKNYPGYYNLKYDNSVVSVQEIKKKLLPTQAIIEYTLTDSVLFAFAITKTSEQLITSPIDETFSNQLTTLRAQLTGKDFNNYTHSDFKLFVSASNGIYKKLLQPFEALIKDKDLILVPDADLGYLSFDVLLTRLPDTTKTTYRKLPYLIMQSALSYAPSATTFFDEMTVRKDNKNNGKILAYSPSYGADNLVLNQKDENGKPLRNSLANLTNTAEEIKNLGEYFNVKAFVGDEATETSFKKYAPDYRVLHLAMHTLINKENPLYSKLIFYRSKNDSADDGMLNASELINMELHADMAVLSACNTGSGKMQKGEGIISLSRDFFYAGVPGIVMTSWAVEDRSGVKLMEYFYKYIAMGKPRHVALRLAKIEYLNNCDKLTSHPHYWAAYMNVGDVSPLTGFTKKTSPFSLFEALATLVSVSVLLMAGMWYKKKLRTP